MLPLGHSRFRIRVTYPGIDAKQAVEFNLISRSRERSKMEGKITSHQVYKGYVSIRIISKIFKAYIFQSETQIRYLLF